MGLYIIVVLLLVVIIQFVIIKRSRNKKASDSVYHSVSTPRMQVEKKPSNQYKQRTINEKKTDIANIMLGDEQKSVFEFLKRTNQNIFITGKAGTGKSILLEYFIANTNKVTVVVAPTGIAALNVGGQTIHSFFKLSPDVQDVEHIRIDDRTKAILRHIETLVIDEISMVRVDIIEAINAKCQIARNNTRPFGGIQVIMFGDLFQLAPVVTDGELHRYFNHIYGSEFFFDAPVFRRNGIKIFELKHVYRQTDQTFIRILDAVRKGKQTDDILNIINSRYAIEVPNDQQFITLTAKNQRADEINLMHLNSLPGTGKIYEATISGDLSVSSYPTEKYLHLKKGAQVMFIRNDHENPRRWVNGTIGVITSISDNVIMVSIDGVIHSINRESWKKLRYYYNAQERKLDKEVLSTFTQFPLRLAWAITIHKSQGQTYQVVAIDMDGGAFAAGQTYVALSRCKTLEGIYLKTQIAADDIIVDQQILSFMENAEVLNI